MDSLTIAAAGKSTLLRGFPVSLKLEKPADVATVADVKAALAAKFPRVRLPLHSLRTRFLQMPTRFTALCRTAKALNQGRTEST